jgi:hypothetical protein
MAVALALRCILVVRGGQQFWPDEDRFELARRATRALLEGRAAEAATITFGTADHLLFRICAIVPALAEQAFHTRPWLPGLFFAAASTAVLWAVGRLATALGGGERERFFTVFAAASSATLLYYSRHFVPYDLSLVFFLLAFGLALQPKRTAWRSFRVGLWTACGFLTYNGYWTLAAAVAGLFLASAADGRSLLGSVMGLAAGFVLPNLVLFAIGQSLGIDMAAAYVDFSRTVKQGDFDQAWRFVGEYFWHAEGLNVIVFAAALGFAFLTMLRDRAASGAVQAALIAMVVYGLIVLTSDTMRWMTVAARHVRAIAPFCALVVGAALARAAGCGRRGRRAALACCILISLVAAINFSAPLSQVFPRDFADAARPVIAARRRAGQGLEPLRLVNDRFLHNPTLVTPTPEGARVLWNRPHPFDYVPYLFEGYPETLREGYLNGDRSMKVLRFAGAEPIRGYPYAFKLAFRLGAGLGNDMGFNEPILGSGSYGEGDLIYLACIPGGTARIGLDHWGGGIPNPLSAPFPFAREREHTLVVIAPCLFAGHADDPVSRRRTERWSNRVRVSVDGAAVMDLKAEFYPADEASIAVGLNLIHSATAGTSLEMTDVRFSALNDADWAREEGRPGGSG